MAALDEWIFYPEEIEADLAFRGIEIGHWHQLTINPTTGAPYLDSRRLLVLLKKLPDTSEYKTWSQRNGEYTDAEMFALTAHNELAQMHRNYLALTVDPENWTDYEPNRFLSRLEREEYWREKQETATEQQRGVDEFNAEIGYC